MGQSILIHKRTYKFFGRMKHFVVLHRILMKTEKGSVFDEIRASEMYELQQLLSLNTLFCHVLGSKGSGKSTLVRKAVENRKCAFVDANLCGSAEGLMSSILISLSNLNRSGPVGSGDVSSGDESDVVCVKKESPVSSPTEVEKGFAQCVRVSRAAKIAANVNIRKTYKPSKRQRRNDVFIDDENDDENEDEGITRAIVDNDQYVSREVFRLIVRAQKMRVRTVSAFIQKLTLLPDEPVVLVVDNIEDNKFVESVFGTLSRLVEYDIKNICVILIGTTFLPLCVSERCVCVNLRPLSSSECEFAIIQDNPNDVRFAPFVKVAVGFLYSQMCGNFVLLRNTVNGLYNRAEFADPKLVTVRAKQMVCQKLNNLFGGGDSHTSFSEQADELVKIQTSVKWISPHTKRVLIAGYLAAHNPVNFDKTIFKSGPNDTKKNRAQTTAFKTARLAADCIQIRAPSSFTFNRLLSIYRYISGESDETDSGFAFQRSIRELTQFGLFKHAGDVWTNEIRLNCHAPLDLIGIVAKQVDIKLQEVLFA